MSQRGTGEGEGGRSGTTQPPQTCQLLRSGVFLVCVCVALLRSALRRRRRTSAAASESERGGQERSSTLHKDPLLKSHKNYHYYHNTQSSSASPTTTSARFAATKKNKINTNNVRTNAQWQIHKCHQETNKKKTQKSNVSVSG